MSIRYTKRLAQTNIDASVGSIGDSYDNAMAETINGLYKTAMQRHLQGFDFSQSKVEQQLIHHLATMEFTAFAQNLALVGGTGTGNTHLAIAIGLQAYSNITRKCASTAR